MRTDLTKRLNVYIFNNIYVPKYSLINELEEETEKQRHKNQKTI